MAPIAAPARVPDTDLDGAFERVLAAIGELPTPAALRACSQYRARLDAIEAKVLAALVEADGDDSRAERQQPSGQASRAERRRRAKRGSLVAANPLLGEAIGNGELCGEHLDLLANAAEKSDGAAATDTDLIAQVGAVGPDQGQRIIKRWLARRAKAADVQAAHDRARRRRGVRRYDTNDGLAGIAIEGDQPSIENIWQQLIADADHTYRTAGGRDVPAVDHEHTHDQRLFDAAHQRLADHPATPARPGAGTSQTSRPTVVVTASIDKLLGRDPHGCAEQVGIGPIADTVLDEYLHHADIVGLLYDGDGQPLKLSRNVRTATRAQLIALMARDRACVLCGAAAHRCEAHHLIPANAPARGPTDTDNLALVCSRCHHQLHRRKQTLFLDPGDHTWKLRPAQPHELPPPRPRPPPRE